MRAFEIFIDVLVACIVIFILPMIWMSITTDQILERKAAAYTAQFAETVSNQGYIDDELYYRFVTELSATGGTYDIELMHEQDIMEPEYVGGIFTGNVMTYESETYTGDIIKAIDARGAYLMEIGDVLTVTVTRRAESVGQRIMRMIYNNTNTNRTVVSRSVSGCSREVYESYFH